MFSPSAFPMATGKSLAGQAGKVPGLQVGGEGPEASLLSQAGHLDLATPGQADRRCPSAKGHR